MDSEAGKKIEVPKDVGEIVIPKACDGGGGGVCVKREGEREKRNTRENDYSTQK